MEYIYAALLLHKAGKKVDEASLKHVLDAVGISPDTAKMKALIAALENVNIDEAVKKAAVAPAAAAAPLGGAEKKDEKKAAEEEKKSEEAAAAGLGALFG